MLFKTTCIAPGRRSVSGTWGSLEATVSMAHAARRRGDPWSGSGAGLGSHLQVNKKPRLMLAKDMDHGS